MRAARLLGAAAALRATTGHPPIDEYQVIHEHNAAAVRTALGEESFAASWAEGQALTLEQAIAYALDERDDGTGRTHAAAGVEVNRADRSPVPEE